MVRPTRTGLVPAKSTAESAVALVVLRLAWLLSLAWPVVPVAGDGAVVEPVAVVALVVVGVSVWSSVRTPTRPSLCTVPHAALGLPMPLRGSPKLFGEPLVHSRTLVSSAGTDSKNRRTW